MRTIKIILLLLTCACCHAQVNLVKNPSFEEYSQCPYLGDQIAYAIHWSGVDSLGTNNCNPDYLNICGTGYASIPANFAGYQYARTGNGMAAIYVYHDESIPIPYKRDYLLGRLAGTLVDGQSYCITFYTAFGEESGYFIDKIGAYLDNGSICTSNNCLPLMQFSPQVENTSGVISDTLNWIKIEGTYTASGIERFITIGNFYDKANTTAVPAFIAGNISYYFIDDVSVIPSDLPAYAGPDTWIASGDSTFIGRQPEIGLECTWLVNGNPIGTGAGMWVHPTATTTYVVEQVLCGVTRRDTVTIEVFPAAVNGLTNSRQLTIYPNPATEEVVVKMEKPVFVKATVINNLGQEISIHPLTGLETRLDISSLPSGMYYLKLEGEEGREVRSFVKM